MAPLQGVWLLYTAPVEHRALTVQHLTGHVTSNLDGESVSTSGDFLRLLFEFGSRGALRVGLRKT